MSRLHPASKRANYAGGRQSAPGPRQTTQNERENMLYTIAVVLIVLWLLGLVTSYTMGGFIHVLLIIAVIMILVNLISGRRPII
jgi:hypothetical protein